MAKKTSNGVIIHLPAGKTQTLSPSQRLLHSLLPFPAYTARLCQISEGSEHNKYISQQVHWKPLNLCFFPSPGLSFSFMSKSQKVKCEESKLKKDIPDSAVLFYGLISSISMQLQMEYLTGYCDLIIDTTPIKTSLGTFLPCPSPHFLVLSSTSMHLFGIPYCSTRCFARSSITPP